MRQRLSFILAASALLAGCLGGMGDEPSDAVGPARSTVPPPIPDFEDPVAIAPIGPSQGEFPISVGPDGQSLLVCTHGGFTGPAPKYGSNDGGATWRQIVVDPPTGISGDCWVDRDDTGAWIFIDSQVAANTVSRTEDNGTTWIVNRLATPPLGGTTDRPYTVPLGGEAFGVTYVQTYLAPGHVMFTRTSDGGVTWSPPVQVTRDDANHPNVMHGPTITDEDRTVIRVPLMRFGATDFMLGQPATGDLGLGVSRDGGTSWSYEVVVRPLEAVFTPPAVAHSDDGVLFWAYQVEDQGGQHIHVTVSKDDGASWSEPVRVAGGWEYIGYMWASGGPDGTAVLSFDAEGSVLHDEASGEHLILIHLDATSDVVASWAEPVASADNSEFAVVAHDAQGGLHVAYREAGQMLYLREAGLP